MKNSNDTIGNRTRDFPTCRTVPQPTAPKLELYAFQSTIYVLKQLLYSILCIWSSTSCQFRLLILTQGTVLIIPFRTVQLYRSCIFHCYSVLLCVSTVYFGDHQVRILAVFYLIIISSLMYLFSHLVTHVTSASSNTINKLHHTHYYNT